MTRYAIGDIHGGNNTFRALLGKLNLCHTDRLYLLGDYIDRGPNSKGVLDTILQLLDAGLDVRPIRGNHDDMMLRNYTGKHDAYSWHWLNGWGTEALKSFGVEDPEDIPVRYLALLESLPYYLKDDNFIYVHAGLDMTKVDPLDAASHMQMLWGRDLCPRPCTYPNDLTLVTGHQIKSLPEIKASLLTNHIYLDNGACTGGTLPDMGNLVALNLDTMALIIQPWLDGEVQL